MQASPEIPPWYRFSNEAEIPSPALLFYPDRIRQNLERMVAIIGDPARLRPHVKTHKCASILRMHLEMGITKFKCATLVEMEMCAMTGATEVLWAYPPMGPNVARLIKLIQRHPNSRISVTVDLPETAQDLSAAAKAQGARVTVLVDIDCGLHRTGLPAGPEAEALYRLISRLPALQAGGLHVYDGQIHDSNPEARARACEAAYAPIPPLIQSLQGQGLAVPTVVVSGTPTFPMHARRPGVECSPGTCVLWDAGYQAHFPDLPFVPAALVLARVISKPASNQLCLDLGHKSIASENPHPRVTFPELPDARALAHNEEHLVIETGHAQTFSAGALVFGIPWHICPTVALYDEATPVVSGHAQSAWRITARGRRLQAEATPQS